MNGAAVFYLELQAVPVVCSKNSSGNRTEGKRRGLLREQGGDTSPPSSSCWALCEEVSRIERTQIWEGPGATSPHTPTSSRRGDPEGKGPEPREKVPEAAWWLQAWRGFLSCLWAHRAWEPLGLDVAGLPESRQAGEESLASPP